MTRIESENRLIFQSTEKLFKFLTNFNNFETIMPDKVKEWTATENSCYFSISGIASLGMRIEEKKPFSFILMLDDGDVPFKFDFLIYLEKMSDKEIDVKLVFDADLNTMMKAVAIKPLKDFLEKILDKLEKINL